MKKPKAKPVANAVFVYISKCHNVQAEKPALTMPDGVGVGRELGHKPKTENVIGLGGWRCTECRKPCSVARIRPQKEKADAA